MSKDYTANRLKKGVLKITVPADKPLEEGGRDRYAGKLEVFGTAANGIGGFETKVTLPRVYSGLNDTTPQEIYQAILAVDWNTVIPAKLKELYIQAVNVDPSQ